MTDAFAPKGFVSEAFDATVRQLSTRTVHDADFHGFAAFEAGTVRHILDIGANRGQSIASFLAVIPNAQIDAFEANPVFFPVLDRIAATLAPRLRVHRCGLGRSEGTFRLYTPWVGDTPYLEESSTRTDYFEKSWVVEKFAARGEMRLEAHEVELKVGDTFGFAPDVVKIDVEGAEFDVLGGLDRTIRRYCPAFLIENSDYHNVTPYLEQRGYRPFRWYQESREFRPYEGATTNAFYFHVTRLPSGLSAWPVAS